MQYLQIASAKITVPSKNVLTRKNAPMAKVIPQTMLATAIIHPKYSIHGNPIMREISPREIKVVFPPTKAMTPLVAKIVPSTNRTSNFPKFSLSKILSILEGIKKFNFEISRKNDA
jgi:hypothetical protein